MKSADWKPLLRKTRHGKTADSYESECLIMDIKIQKAELTDIELLMKWSMRVLHEVFDISDSEPAQGLERANRIYYQSALQAGGHIACFACQGKEIIGCGGICLYQEMPSPDNLSRQCAYLMNIYTCPGFRGGMALEK